MISFNSLNNGYDNYRKLGIEYWTAIQHKHSQMIGIVLNITVFIGIRYYNMFKEGNRQFEDIIK